MHWPDPARARESETDRELREELSSLLGLPPRNFFAAEPTPQMIALAEDLRREALRRRHTARQRPFRLLLAAGLPIALAVGALASWGYQHKQRADALAAAITRRETGPKNTPVPTVTEVRDPAPVVVLDAPRTPTLARNAPSAPRRIRSARPEGGELVLEVKPYQLPSLDTQPVKGQE